MNTSNPRRLRDSLMSAFLLLCAACGAGFLWLAFRRQTILWYELLWLGTGIIGAAVVLWMLRDLVNDRDLLRADGLNGGDELLNATAIGINGFLLGIEGSIVLIGYVAILLPSSAQSGNQAAVTPLRVALTLSFFLIAACADGCALWMRVRRGQLRAYLRRNYDADHISQLAPRAAQGGIP